MSLHVTNIAKDQFNSNIGSNVIHVDLADIGIDCPMVAAHQSEIKQAKTAEIPLTTKLIQYVHRVESKKKITSKKIKDDIIQNIKTVLDENPECLVDVFFQYWKEYYPSSIERQNILEIQEQAGCLIISDYEINPNQSAIKFEEQLQYLLKAYPQKIISPTLDLGTNSPQIFADKIDLLFKYGIKRFNVIFRNMIDSQDNWITLSAKIYGKDIWCNLVGVPRQYNSSTDTFSQIASVFLYGVHTASLQYPRFSKKINRKTIQDEKSKISSKKIYTFNSNTGCFEVTISMTEEQARANSINALVEYAKRIQHIIILGKFYSEFVPSQPALLQLLPII